MKSFSRAVRIALRYRWTLVGAFVCSLLVGLLWGGNIGAVYPFVEIVSQNQSLRGWVDRQITDSQDEAARIDAHIGRLREQLAAAKPEQRRRIEQNIALEKSRLRAEQRALARARWLRPYIHAYTPKDPFPTLLAVILVVIVATAIKDLCLVGNLNLVARAAHLTALDLRREFHRRALHMDINTFGEGGDKELMTRFTQDIEWLTIALNFVFGPALREPLKMMACLGGAAFICWRLLVFSLLIVPLALLLITTLAKSIKRASRRALEEMTQLYGLLSETFAGIQVVKAFTMEAFERSRFYQTARTYFRRQMRIVFYNSLTKPATELLGIGVISLAILAGAYLVLYQQTHLFGIRMCDRPLSLSAILVFYGLLAGVTDPARKLSDMFALLQKGAAAADRIYEQLDREPVVVDPANPQPVPSPHRELVFENVHFRYGDGPPVLRGIDLTIPYGQTLAVVGPNGCGKTTLVNLIPRFFDPEQGSVRIDGLDLRQVRLRDLRSQIGLVTQKTLLFNDTIRSNIRYGSPHAADEQVEAAARQAHAHEFIVGKLDDGYDTLAGSGGCRLSGGQSQRIALARAILRDPEILLLDEATSQIDLESERLIQEVLQEFTRGRTTIMITHRLSTLTLADRILVLDAGQMCDMGTHEELIARCDVYRRLYQVKLSA
jgi:ATP-binding cassette subfamily B protein/subfamily B ATP-binding cassette protein MsbA